MLHPRRSAQHVLLCNACETVPLQSHCELCNISLCTNCVGNHLLDSSTKHRVVPFTERKRSTTNFPKCPSHIDKYSELYCEKCDIPVCSTCVSSGKHKGHDISDIQKKISAKTQGLKKDLEELETSISPRYEEIISYVQTEKTEIETNYGKLTRATDHHGEVLHREITAIVNRRKSDIAEMKTKHLAVLKKSTDEITHNITELKQTILNLKAILESNDVSLISTYKSRNAEFRRLPPKVRIRSPSLSPQKLDKNQLNEMFGSLPPLSISKEQGYIMNSLESVSSPPINSMKSPGATPSLPVKPMKSAEAVSPPPVKSLLDEPRFNATIDTGYGSLYSVSCLSGEQVWTCGDNNIMKLLNLQGELLTSIQTKSRNRPMDIAVTRDGDLVYTDNRTVNLVKNREIQTVITLQGWTPLRVCSTSINDLLVTMISVDYRHSKVVRYSGSKEKQTIQFDDRGYPLYSSGPLYKYIIENKNLDICVADWGAKAVVVVNRSGKLRFKYTGHPSNTKKSFNPAGITADSQGHILAADSDNNCIHILDQYGRFLRYIQNVSFPYGLCVDIRDNLFVAQSDTAKVEKIQYL